MSNKETKKARPSDIRCVRSCSCFVVLVVCLVYVSVIWFHPDILFSLFSMSSRLESELKHPFWNPGYLDTDPKNQDSEKLISKEREEELRAILGPVPGCCFGLSHCLAHQMRVCTQSVCAEPDSPLHLAPQMLGTWAVSSLQVRPLGS